MTEALKAALVRIRGANGGISGTGFLAADRHVVTCAHVVAQALGCAESQAEPPAGEVSLDFPHLAPQTLQAGRVIGWYPVRLDQPAGAGGAEDIAVLELARPPPPGCRPVRLINAGDLWGHGFRAFGFPAGADAGVWASGVCRDSLAGGWVQIEDTKETGYRVAPGFSGGPVWDEQAGGVIGMVVAADRQAAVKAAFIIPTAILAQAWPELARQAIPPCPYRGLFAFREQDAPFFFGREAFVQQLVEAVHRRSLVAVLGASGSGKSSVVFAGLVPHLRREGDWLIASFRPGDHPFRMLAGALLPLLEPDMSETDRLVESRKLVQALEQRELAVGDITGRIVQIVQKEPAATRFLLIADQFEELYTLCADPAERQRFLDVLLDAVRVPAAGSAGPFHLVLTMRADFCGHALSYRPFADALQDADLKLGPMTEQELRDAIEQPAHKLGVAFEDGLVERILEAVRGQPGSLPLLQFALTVLWEGQTDGRLTHETYDRIGGVERALAGYAEEVFERLAPEEQARARRVLLQLVRPGEGTQDTKRVAVRDEVGNENWELVARLASARLVVSSRDEPSGAETVEFVHEALIGGWGRLREWMDADRKFRTWQERLRAALHQWEATGRPDDALLRGVLLAEAEEALAERSEDLSEQEEAFIQASLALRDRQRAERERGRRRAIMALAGGLLTATLLAVTAVAQWWRADMAGRVAVARQLAAQSELLRGQQASLLPVSVLLAVESVRRLGDPPGLEADQALRHGLAILPRRIAALPHDPSPGAPPFSSDNRALVAFSYDGRYLATAGVDRTARLWNARTGEPVQSIAHARDVLAVALSSDGTRLATATEGGRVQLWEVPSGRAAGSPLLHQGDVRALAFSPGGRYLATGGPDGARLWDAQTGDAAGPLLPHGRPVTALAFAGDDRLGTASEDRTACVWELPDGRRLRCVEHGGAVRDVALSQDGALVATASNDGAARLWAAGGDEEPRLLRHAEVVRTIALSRDSRQVATGSEDKTARVWEAATGRELARMPHEDDIAALDFSSTGKYLATASEDRTARLWEVATGREVLRMAHGAKVSAVALSPDDARLATGSIDGTAALWDATSRPESTRVAHAEEITRVAFSPDGRVLATGSQDGAATLWELPSGQPVARLPAHQGSVLGLAVSPDGRSLATANWDGTARVWDLRTGGPAGPALAHTGRVTAAAYSPDGRHLVTATRERAATGTVQVWEAGTWRRAILLQERSAITGVAFSPDGRRLAASTSDGTVAIWQTASWKIEQRLCHNAPDGMATGPNDPCPGPAGQAVEAVAFGPDGRTIAAAGANGLARLWRVDGWRATGEFPHEKKVHAVAFSPDGQMLSTASGDSAWVWEIATRRRLARITHDNDRDITTVAFRPDGRALATASLDGTARVWSLRAVDLIAEACARLPRDLETRVQREYLRGERPARICPTVP